VSLRSAFFVDLHPVLECKKERSGLEDKVAPQERERNREQEVKTCVCFFCPGFSMCGTNSTSSPSRDDNEDAPVSHRVLCMQPTHSFRRQSNGKIIKKTRKSSFGGFRSCDDMRGDWWWVTCFAGVFRIHINAYKRESERRCAKKKKGISTERKKP
jgi:hypothetical protein